MACVRKRRGKFVVDWRDGAGLRHWKTFDRMADANAHLHKVASDAQHKVTPTLPATSTVDAYAAHWLRLIGPTVKKRTFESYTEILHQHLLPAFAAVRVRDLDRGRIKGFLAEKLTGGLKKRTVRNVGAVLRSLLNAAIEDGLIAANPAAKLGRVLKLGVAKGAAQETIKAMTSAQRHHFLATARRKAPRYYPLFFTLRGTGCRLGEVLGMQWGDVDLAGKAIKISRAFSEDGTLGTPKSGHGRDVDLSTTLADTLATHELTQKQETLKYGWPEVPVWVFVTKEGTPLNARNVRRR